MYLSETRLMDINRLRDRIWGEVVLPDDVHWDESRRAFNLAVDQQPAAIVMAESAEDVQAAVRFARKHGMRVAPQTTGHNAGPLEDRIDDTLIVNTSRMKGVAIDQTTRIARVQAGTVWGEVVERLKGSGFAALHGSSPTVGVVGYSLGGGVGFLARKHGMQVNRITAIDLVNEFGDRMRVTADEHEELFWALRGGGGNFGVVTALEFQLVEVSDLQAGMLIWPWEHADRLLKTWLAMLPALPEELTTTFRLMQFPPFPELPDFLRGRRLVVVDGALLGDAEMSEQLLAPLREIEPEIDTWGEVPPEALAPLHMDPEEPASILSDHLLIERVIDPATATRLVELAGPGSDSPLVSFELRHIGGALARSNSACGARGSLPGELLFFSVVPLLPGVDPTAITAHGARLREVLEPLATRVRYSNLVEQPARLADFFDPQSLARLAAVKAEYDAAGIFQGNFEF